MNILIDGMGGDNAPLEIVKGAVKAADKIDGKITIIGREEEIIKAFEKIGYTKGKIEIVNATEVVTNNEAPAMAVRKKKHSRSLRLMRELHHSWKVRILLKKFTYRTRL